MHNRVPPNSQRLILASQSVYKKQLLERLQVPFITLAPRIDETPKATELPAAVAERLAYEKAKAIAAEHPDHYVIGCDQTAICQNQILGKPGTAAHALEQLNRISNQTLFFYTAISLYNPTQQSYQQHTTITEVTMRALSTQQIQDYITKEPAFDCVGACKSEGLGISLCESIQSHDPTALVGLPLIAVCDLLRQNGFALL